MSKKATGTKPQCSPLARRDQYVRANIEGFTSVVLRLQHLGHHEAALDLTREAFGAADSYARLYRLDKRA